MSLSKRVCNISHSTGFTFSLILKTKNSQPHKPKAYIKAHKATGSINPVMQSLHLFKI